MEKSSRRDKNTLVPLLGRGGSGILIMAFSVFFTAGCFLTPRQNRADGGTVQEQPSGRALSTEAQIARMEALVQAGAYSEAMDLYLAVTREGPITPELQETRQRIVQGILDRRSKALTERSASDKRRAALDIAEQQTIPDTFAHRRSVPERPLDLIVPTGGMHAMLDRPITLRLQSAGLQSLIHALAAQEDINLIADESLAEGRQVNIDISDVPLREVLAYLSRQYDIQFHTGANMIWAMPAGSGTPRPMETRVYRLRTGLQFHGEAWGALSPDQSKALVADISTLTRKATVLPSATSYMETVIRTFVPESEGAALHIDYNTHTLFVRDTPENLALIASIVEALDVNPPQVLIEARFIEISNADLREVGVDWILGSPLTLMKKGVEDDGVWSREPKVQIDPDGSITHVPYRSDDAGAFPLGPQGPFGLTRAGNPPTADQGLNLTFRGVLTEPVFSAVLHAIEVSGKGRTLSVPRVTTINNNPAKLRDGDDLLYYEEFQAQAFSLVDANNRQYTVTALIPRGAPKVAELGFTLVAVPSVGADNRTISLLLTPTISELKEFISYQDDIATEEGRPDRSVRQVAVKLPRISRREVQTKVVVDSGETVVMGGLIRSVSQDTVRRVPILGSLPLLGPFFRRTDVTEEQRNLLIFVTATVISERGESLVPLAATTSTASQRILDTPSLGGRE